MGIEAVLDGGSMTSPADWYGVDGELVDDGTEVRVVATASDRHQGPVLGLATSGRVPAVSQWLEGVMNMKDRGARAAALTTDPVVIWEDHGRRRVVSPHELTRLRRPHRGSLAAVLGGRPTVGTPVGATIPRNVTVADAELDEVAKVLRSGRLGLGKYNERAAALFAEVFGIPHVQLAANGSVVLALALRALGIAEGARVLVPTETFQASVAWIRDAHAVPVWVDCRAGNLTIDPEAVRAELEGCVDKDEPMPFAVIAAAMYHQLPDLPLLRQICDRFGMKLVLDFAHGPYAEVHSLPATRYADVVTYSFQQSKSLSLGEGGAIGTHDPSLAPALAQVVSCGYQPWGQLTERLVEGLLLEPDADGGFVLPSQFAPRLSVNYRMAEVQAAQLLVRLATFMDVFDRAVENIAALQKVVAEFRHLVVPLDSVPNTRGPFYKWGFKVDPEWMPAETFRWALQAQLGFEVVYCYPALTLNDQRNPLPFESLEGLVDEEYLAAISGKRDVPNAIQAGETAALLEWPFLVSQDPAEKLRRALETLERDTELILDRS